MIISALICSLLAMILVGVAYFAALRRYDELMRRYDALKRDDDILTKLQHSTTELFGQIEGLELSNENIKESFLNMNNKIAARAMRERKSEREDQPPVAAAPAEDGLQQQQGNGTVGRQVRFVRKQF